MKHLKLGLVQTGDPLKLCTDQYNAFCDAMKDVLGVELIQSEWEINGAALYTLPSGGCGLVPARTDAGKAPYCSTP